MKFNGNHIVSFSPEMFFRRKGSLIQVKPMKGTEIIFDADTLLIAVGLTPVDELKSQAEKFGLKTYSAGDSDVISEASAAMISGKIVAYKILRKLGYNIEIPPEWNELIKIFGSKPECTA